MKDFVVDVDLNNNDLINVDSVSFNTSTSDSPAVGKLVWDDGEGTLSYGVKGGNINLQVGSDLKLLCTNQTGSVIAKGKVVYINGAQGNRPTIALADADVEATSSKTLGITAESINNGAEGFVATFGILTGLDTSAFTAGQALWLSSTAGGLTATPPAAPANSVFVGYAISINASSGRIFVNVQNGYELGELHNVVLDDDVNIAENEVLAYDATNDLWKNRTASEAGLATTGHTHSSALDDLTDVDLNPAITVVSTSSQSAGASTSMTFTLPSSMQQDDICVVLVGSDGSQPAKPSGWSEISSATFGNGFQRLLFKQMGSTPDTTVSLTGLSTASTAVAVAIRGASLQTWTSVTSGHDPASVVDPPAVTTTVANSLVLVMAAVDDSNITTFTAPTNYSNFVYSATNLTAPTGMTTMLATRIVSATGSENPGSFGSTTVNGEDSISFSIVFQPVQATHNDLLVYNPATSQWNNVSPNRIVYDGTVLAGYDAWYPKLEGNVTTWATGTGFLRFVPFFTDKTIHVDRIGVEVTTSALSGGVVRLGIYNSDSDMMPSTVLLDAGTVSSVVTAPAWVEITISQVLQPGLYWLAVVGQTATSTLRAYRYGGWMPVTRFTSATPSLNVDNHNAFQMASVSGALPTFSFGTIQGGAPRVLVRVS
jgi:hypothetical protein